MFALVGSIGWIAAVSGFAEAATGTTAAPDWVEIETQHFLVLSNADPRAARNVALEFEQARAVFRNAISADTDMDPALPIVIFALRERGDLSRLLPGVRGELPVGVFSNSPDRHRIAVRLDEPSTHRFHVVYHEYHHLLFRSAVGRAPVWLVEGLAEFWSTMETRPDGSIEIGRPSPQHLRTLRLGRMMPLQQLLRYEGSVHNEPQQSIAILYAQSWALVHHLMLGERTKGGGQRLDRYIALVENGGDPVEAFETIYGSAVAVERSLVAYLDRTMFPAMRIETPEPPPASEFRTRALSMADATAAIGAFVATGPWPEEALPHLERALALDAHSTTAMEGMGFLRFRAGDFDAAEAWFEKAADADATSYLAHYYLGVLAMERGRSAPIVETRLKRAIELNSKFAPAFVALSTYLSDDAARLDEALALAEEATRLAPNDGDTWSNLAAVLFAMNRPEQARRAMERALANPPR